MAGSRAFIQHPGKAVEMDERFKYVMAITLNPQSGNREGLLRCITSRSGEIGVHGNLDRSILSKVNGDTLEKFSIGEPLVIKNETEIIANLATEEREYIGLEDPDIWIDPASGRMHVYFTIPFVAKEGSSAHSLISLGHAEGDDLGSLVMTEPVLRASETDLAFHHAKEVSIAPVNRNGVRLNLFESDAHRDAGPKFSTVRVAIAEDMGKPWQFGETVFHPGEHNLPWIAEHASPGPLLPRSFIDLGPNKLLGIMNGREASILDTDGEEAKYRMFSVGLFIYDYELGKIDWVSPEPLIRDTEAKTITFASHFVETAPGEGILYAHVDDSFVRAYTLYAEGIRSLLP